MARKNDGIYQREDRCGEYWISWKDAQGKRRRRKTDAQNVTQAKLALAAEKLNAEKEKTLGFRPPTEDSFSTVADRFLKHQYARLTSAAYERERGIVEDHLKKFFNCPLRGIRRVDVQRYVTKRSADVQAETIRKELNVLKHCLKLAVEWEIIPLSPAQGIKGPKAPAGRVRYLQQTELEAVLLACPEWLRPIAILAVATGMRRSEILKLRWLDVDLLNKRLMLPQTKNGDGRIVYLNETADKVFRTIAQGKSVNMTDRIFRGMKPEHVSVTFLRACRKCGILDFRFHDLRHTAASWLRMAGADIHTVAQLLGHKDLRMAARYQHLSAEFLGAAVNKLDALIAPPIGVPAEVRPIGQSSGNPPNGGISRHQGVTSQKQLKEGEFANA